MKTIRSYLTLSKSHFIPERWFEWGTGRTTFVDILMVLLAVLHINLAWNLDKLYGSIKSVHTCLKGESVKKNECFYFKVKRNGGKNRPEKSIIFG